MAGRHSVLTVAVGTLVAVTLVVGTYSSHVIGPITVRFDGVALHSVYLNNSSEYMPRYIGPVEQNACDETFSLGPGSPSLRQDCPIQLVGGHSYDFGFFTVGNPGNSPGLWANMTVTAPFHFEVNPGLYGVIPTTYSNTTGLYEGGDHFLYGAGEWLGWVLVFTFPTALNSPLGGLWLNANLTIQPTNETTVPT